jgi:hypothetical protein
VGYVCETRNLSIHERSTLERDELNFTQTACSIRDQVQATEQAEKRGQETKDIAEVTEMRDKEMADTLFSQTNFGIVRASNRVDEFAMWDLRPPEEIKLEELDVLLGGF